MGYYSNSSLVTYRNITQEKTSPRSGRIKIITPHCYVGQVTAKQGVDGFAKKGRGASAQYVIGYDGSIGQSVDEADRAWTTGGLDANKQPIKVNGISGADNDHEAVTIEVASDKVHPYTITDAAYDALVRLMADIATRNGIPELRWRGDKSLVGRTDLQNITAHRWFANKACPGDYIYNRLGAIAEAANKLIGTQGGGGAAAPETTTGGLYRVRRDWADSKSQVGAYRDLSNATRAADSNPGFSVYDETGRKVYPAAEFRVLISTDLLRIRTGPGTNYSSTGAHTGKGIFTIVQEASGVGSDSGWGRLKSGAGWVALDFCKRI